MGALQTSTLLFRNLCGRALDVLLPPQCLSCGTIIEETGALCIPCWQKMRFIEKPVCATCGVPSSAITAESTLCIACVRQRRSYDRARAAIIYDDSSKGLILRYKNADRTDMAPAFARWMIRAGQDVLADADILVPVPLHWTRLFSRHYNQAALLANEIGKRTRTPTIPDLLIRHKRTKPLGKLGPTARVHAVRDAISMKRKGRDRINGRRVLLIDDVYTTGATTDACVNVLLEGGAACVDVLTLARVVRPDP